MVVNAVLGECIWNLSYNERRMAIELELTKYLEEEDADALICQFPVPAVYDLNGRMVKRLGKGLFVKGGKKIILK